MAARKGRGRNAGKAPEAPVYIVSGGSGASGELIVETVLAQFPGLRAPVVKVPRVRDRGEVLAALRKAAGQGATVVHTLVDGALREALSQGAREMGVAAIDLMGPLMERLSQVSGLRPEGRPGLYRSLRKEYFDRVEAINFAVAHDDGQRAGDLGQAEVVLVGVSRSGKTPISMYLAVHGWKAANVPIVKGIEPPGELFEIDRRRVVGLSISHEHLMAHRKRRAEGLGRASAYARPGAVFEELEEALELMARAGFHTVSVTDKPVESIAEEIMGYVSAGAGRMA
ncbi:MAG: pyruvate, water dikinase regulatory protein [Thermodesulfovibrionales bacterium]